MTTKPIDANEAFWTRPTSWEKYDDEMEPEGEVNVPDVKTRLQIERDLQQFASYRREKSPEELVEIMLKEFEFNYNSPATQQQRWAGQARWQGRENEEMRVMNIRHPYWFMRQLRRAGIDARESESRHARLWLNSWSLIGRIGVNAWVRGEVRTITTLQYPYGPEWSVMRFNDYNVPTNEKYRGWRTALLALIIADAITEDEAERAFGKVSGEASIFYRQQLQNNRTVKMGLLI